MAEVEAPRPRRPGAFAWAVLLLAACLAAVAGFALSEIWVALLAWALVVAVGGSAIVVARSRAVEGQDVGAFAAELDAATELGRASLVVRTYPTDGDGRRRLEAEIRALERRGYEVIEARHDPPFERPDDAGADPDSYGEWWGQASRRVLPQSRMDVGARLIDEEEVDAMSESLALHIGLGILGGDPVGGGWERPADADDVDPIVRYQPRIIATFRPRRP